MKSIFSERKKVGFFMGDLFIRFQGIYDVEVYTELDEVRKRTYETCRQPDRFTTVERAKH
ncbi:hypothetical protein [Dokdonia pacifica]|nr:hypothetical protein [Dokdonia pacifica]